MNFNDELPVPRVGDFRLNKAFMMCFIEAIVDGVAHLRYSRFKTETRPVKVVSNWRLASGNEVLERLNLRDKCNWALAQNRR